MNKMQRIGVATLILFAFALTVWGGHQSGATGQALPDTNGAAPTRQPAMENAVRVAKDPTDLPGPVTWREPEHVVVDMEAVELIGELADGTTYEYWTFDRTVPGPLIRARVGDTVEIRLTNAADSGQIHSIDLHAVNGPGGGAPATQVKPGETKSFTFKALNPGVYIYHCASPFIPSHVALGMYGLIVIEPEEGLPPVDREFYIVQGEIYADLRPGDNGHAKYDAESLFMEQPNFVVFNGQYLAVTGDHAMHAEVGDRIRIFVGNGGPNLISSFHVIGEIFDAVHPEGATEALHNVQTTLVPAGGATWVEFTLDYPGQYVLVDHALQRAMGKGTLASLEVTGPADATIFSP